MPLGVDRLLPESAGPVHVPLAMFRIRAAFSLKDGVVYISGSLQVVGRSKFIRAVLCGLLRG